MDDSSIKDMVPQDRQQREQLKICEIDSKAGTNARTALAFMIPLFALATAVTPLLLSPGLPAGSSPEVAVWHSAAPEGLPLVPVIEEGALNRIGIEPPFKRLQDSDVAWIHVPSPRDSESVQKSSKAAEQPDPTGAPTKPETLNDLQQSRFERFYRRWLTIPEELRPPPMPIDFHASAPEMRADNRTGVYLTGSSVARDEFLIETLDAIAKNPNPAIVVDVKGSFIYFQTDAPLANQHGLVKPLYELPELYRMTQDRGIYLIARYIAIKDDSLSRVLPETQVRNMETNAALGLGWVDPAHPTTLEYNRQIIEDVVPYVDEINLDYIRYSTSLPAHFYGVNGDQKADRIEEFLKMTREVIDRVSPQTKFGISTYAILGWNFPVNLEPLGQHIPRFAKYVDVISPMAYPATFAEGAYYNPAKHPRSRMYYLVYRTLTGYNELVGETDQHKIRPWIQGYGVTTQNMRDQMDAVYDAGHCGFQVWSAGNNYGPTYAALDLTPQPERCL